MEHIKILHSNAVTVISMDRPAKHNALNPSMLCDFRTAILGTSSTDTLVISATSAIFSSGLDLDHLKHLWGAQRGLVHYFEMLHALYSAIHAHPAPTFAVVSKGAFGGGFGLACCCDLILADENCRFVLPGKQFGNLARLARPPLMTKLPFIELEDVSSIELTREEAHKLGLCENLAPLPPYSNLDTFSAIVQARRERRLLKNSQENFEQWCKRIRELVLADLPNLPPEMNLLH